MMEQMKIKKRLEVLFITEFLPWPLHSGGRIRSYQILRQVALKHDVTLIAADHDGVESYFTNFVKEVHVVPAKGYSKLFKFLRFLISFFSEKPFMYVYSSYNAEMRKKINEVIRRVRFDIIHIDHLDAAVYLSNCEKRSVYLDEHNYETQLLRSLKDLQKNVFGKFYLTNQIKKIEKFEGNALQCADAIGAVSYNDAQMMAKWVPKEKISVIPNGVDTNFFKIPRIPEPFHLVSVASLDWHPNVDGLIWFLKNVWPVVAGQKKDTFLTIVGRNPPRKLYRYADDRIRIQASVPDVRVYVQNASVFVVPVFAGGGTRLKILEAMAMDIPIVSTSKGAEGIDYTDGVNICIADDADMFIRKIFTLFEKKDLSRSVAASARNLVKNNYSWDAAGLKLETVYQKLKF